MRLISWVFSDTESTNLAIGSKILVSKGQWDGLLFSTCGLGLSKEERELFDSSFLRVRNTVNLYFGKVVISFSKNGIYEHLRGVKIVKEATLGEVILNWISTKKVALENRYNAWLNKRQFKEIYGFELCRSWEGFYTFKSDMLSAFQLASNYEADLYFRGRLIYSPLGFEYEDNRAQVEKYLGRRFLTPSGYNLRGYKDPWSDEIQEYKRWKED